MNQPNSGKAEWVVVVRNPETGSTRLPTGHSSTSLSIKEHTSLKTRKNAHKSMMTSGVPRRSWYIRSRAGTGWHLAARCVIRTSPTNRPSYSFGQRIERDDTWRRDLSLNANATSRPSYLRIATRKLNKNVSSGMTIILLISAQQWHLQTYYRSPSFVAGWRHLKNPGRSEMLEFKESP